MRGHILPFAKRKEASLAIGQTIDSTAIFAVSKERKKAIEKA